jgi:hypothetical protein
VRPDGFDDEPPAKGFRVIGAALGALSPKTVTRHPVLCDLPIYCPTGARSGRPWMGVSRELHSCQRRTRHG